MHEPEPRWMALKPGLERAGVVLRPHATTGDAYIRVAKYKGWLALPGRVAKTFGGAIGLPIVAVSYDDHLATNSRMASAARTERALETDDFLAILDDEGLWVSRSDGKWQVLTGDTGTDGPVSRTLRGAYVGYHLHAATVESCRVAEQIEAFLPGQGRPCPFLPGGPLHNDLHVDAEDPECYAANERLEDGEAGCRACIKEELEDRAIGGAS